MAGAKKGRGLEQKKEGRVFATTNCVTVAHWPLTSVVQLKSVNPMTAAETERTKSA